LVGTARFVHEAAAPVSARRTDEDTFAYNWTGRRSLGTLRDARVGILGMGGIGVELALRLRAFVPRSVRYTKRVPFAESIERTLGAFAGSPSEIVSTSDVLFCLLPFSAQTEGWLNAERIASMPAGSRLVCLGSGSVVDEAAVVGAVRAGHLAGAAFDTFEWEPLPIDHPLAAAARVPGSGIVLTPHVAALGSDADAALGWDEIGRWMRGEALLHRIG
jgi:phosphoglycerate dehydrogenase-like enzyme